LPQPALPDCTHGAGRLSLLTCARGPVQDLEAVARRELAAHGEETVLREHAVWAAERELKRNWRQAMRGTAAITVAG